MRPRSAKDIAEKVNKILKNRNLAKKLGKNAEKIVKEKLEGFKNTHGIKTYSDAVNMLLEKIMLYDFIFNLPQYRDGYESARLYMEAMERSKDILTEKTKKGK